MELILGNLSMAEGGNMLQVQKLSIYLKNDLREIIKDFDFILNAGDKVALIGEEGNGKSLLIKAIIDKSLIEDFAEIKGEIYKKGEIFAYLPQNVDQHLHLSTSDYIRRTIGEIDYNLYYKLITELDFNENLISDSVKLNNLSGGERIKFVLFVELLKEPTVLLLDEPSNDLDINSIKWLENFLLKTKLPFIFVSHDTDLLAKVSNRVIHIEQFQKKTNVSITISNVNYENYRQNRESFLENETRIAKKENEEFNKKIERFKNVHDKVENALRATKNDLIGRNLKDKMHTVKAIGRRLEKEKENLTQLPDTEHIIDIKFHDVHIPNGQKVINIDLEKLDIGGKILSQNIKLEIYGPEKICIVGNNGAGKTTLLKKIAKELEDKKFKVGYMTQNYLEVKDYNSTATEFLSKTFSKSEHTEISNFLSSLNFTRDEMFSKVSKLSGGQKAKLFFAKMIMDRAEILILDEPTRNLSPTSVPEVINALKNFGGAIIAVSHDRKFIDAIFDKVYFLDREGLKIES